VAGRNGIHVFFGHRPSCRRIEIRAGIVCACLVLATWRAPYWKLRWFLIANLFETTACEIALHRWAYSSVQYGVVFSLGAAAIFCAALPLAWASVPYRQQRFAVAAVALLFAGLAFGCDIGGTRLALASCIDALNGSGDVFLAAFPAIGTAYLYAQRGNCRLAFGLMTLWLAQAAFEFGWTLHWNAHDWIVLNDWLPSMLVAAGSIWLACFCAPKPLAIRDSPDL
jgi:hypothetical protein